MGQLPTGDDGPHNEVLMVVHREFQQFFNNSIHWQWCAAFLETVLVKLSTLKPESRMKTPFMFVIKWLILKGIAEWWN